MIVDKPMNYLFHYNGWISIGTTAWERAYLVPSAIIPPSRKGLPDWFNHPNWKGVNVTKQSELCYLHQIFHHYVKRWYCVDESDWSIHPWGLLWSNCAISRLYLYILGAMVGPTNKVYLEFKEAQKLVPWGGNSRVVPNGQNMESTDQWCWYTILIIAWGSSLRSSYSLQQIRPFHPCGWIFAGSCFMVKLLILCPPGNQTSKWHNLVSYDFFFVIGWYSWILWYPIGRIFDFLFTEIVENNFNYFIMHHNPRKHIHCYLIF